jgi:hypothetical protein
VSWRAVFFLNVPLAVGVLWLSSVSPTRSYELKPRVITSEFHRLTVDALRLTHTSS